METLSLEAQSFYKKLYEKTKHLLKKRVNLDEKISNPITLNEFHYRKLIKEMIQLENTLYQREKEFHLGMDHLGIHHFLENNQITQNLLSKTSELHQLWTPSQNGMSIISIDYAQNILDQHSEGFSRDVLSFHRVFIEALSF